MSTIGTRLREERQKLGLNQSEFAEICGVSGKTQGLYERDTRAPDAEYLNKIGDRIDVLYVVMGVDSSTTISQKHLADINLVFDLARKYDLRGLEKEQIDPMCKFITVTSPEQYDLVYKMLDFSGNVTKYS